MPVPRTLTGGLLCLWLLAAALPATAHPEDEFCSPGEAGLDPELCAALSTLDRKEAAVQELAPLVDESGAPRNFWSSAGHYLTIGIGHILPAGLDHILFVLALFLASTTVAALLWQISAFTVAHTATLGLAAAGVLAFPAAVVEPLIAATITLVALENLFFRSLPRWRVLVVFLFGLVHGLGFAGFFGELGLAGGQFWSALLGFNLGVEIGQLGVLLLAVFLSILFRRTFPALRTAAAWRRSVVVPVSLLIGITGIAWTIERIVWRPPA